MSVAYTTQSSGGYKSSIKVPEDSVSAKDSASSLGREKDL